MTGKSCSKTCTLRYLCAHSVEHSFRNDKPLTFDTLVWMEQSHDQALNSEHYFDAHERRSLSSYIFYFKSMY